MVLSSFELIFHNESDEIIWICTFCLFCFVLQSKLVFAKFLFFRNVTKRRFLCGPTFWKTAPNTSIRSIEAKVRNFRQTTHISDTANFTRTYRILELSPNLAILFVFRSLCGYSDDSINQASARLEWILWKAQFVGSRSGIRGYFSLI